jgi:crossover junction endodeoxyribonuclease RusA
VTQRLWRIELTSPYLSGNHRLHWRAKAGRTALIRHEVHIRARALHIPDLTGRCQVELTYIPKIGRGPDPDNLWPTEKAAIDGLQDAGVLRNDRQQDVRRAVPFVAEHDKYAPAQLILTITDLGAE